MEAIHRETSPHGKAYRATSTQGKRQGSKNRRHTSGKGRKDVGETRMMPMVRLRSATYATVHSIFAANALKAMGEAG
eukprot:1806604-Pyramimonas_sp.AAC.1